MTASREPSNQSFEVDREATVCTASRRFLPFCGRKTTPTTARRVKISGETTLAHSARDAHQAQDRSTREVPRLGSLNLEAPRSPTKAGAAYAEYTIRELRKKSVYNDLALMMFVKDQAGQTVLSLPFFPGC